MKKGLVLEGGAMRGIFTCGVLDVLMENGITFDGAAGVSAGAAFGCNFKSNQPGRAFRYNMRFAKDRRYGSLYSLFTTGDYYGGNFCYHLLPDQLNKMDYETYRKNPMEFWCCATDVITGKPVYKNLSELDYNNLEFMRASASMPVVSKPVSVDGKLLLDGGITDSIPLEFMEKQGYEKNLVVLTQPEEYQKGPASLMSLMKLLLKKYPLVLEAMKKRHVVYNQQKEYAYKRQSEKAVLIIAPEKSLEISRTCHDRKELERVYEIGRALCLKRLEEIKAFLKD